MTEPTSRSADRPAIVLIGMMGSGKTSIGRRLARRLGLPFVDADDEIVKAAGCSIEDIFARYGEQAFRDGERRVIGRLLDGGAQVLATGGGAFMDPATRARIRTSAVSIWLRANLDILVERTGRHGGRPLLERCDRRETLTRLMNERHPVYAEADIVIDTTDESHDVTVERAVAALAERGHLIALRSEARL